MQQGKEEAWELFGIYWKGFPQPATAQFIVRRAFHANAAETQQAIHYLWDMNYDAKSVANLANAVLNGSSIEVIVNSLNRMFEPGAYGEEALRIMRRHGDPEVRAAVIAAMSRSPKLNDLLVQTLRESLLDRNRHLGQAVQNTMENLHIPNPVTGPWLEEQVLKLDGPEILEIAVEKLKTFEISQEFPRKVFNRIDSNESTEIKLLLIASLLDHTVPKSESAMKLRTLQEQMESLYVLEMRQQLESDLRFMIEQSEIIKRLAERENIEQLKVLLEIVDE